MNKYNTVTVSDKHLGEQYKVTVLPSGLTVMCCEKPDRRGIYAVYGAAIGSTLEHYTVGEKSFTLPAGTAHYLEHKLFAGKLGDAFELFAKTGAAANAFTSYERTCYVFGANENIEQSLSILLEFVSSPYFTKENVEKERGIITQELGMYLDNPDVQLLDGVLKLMYHRNPIRNDIGGTVESISEITPETLYGAYNAFYHPENMVLAVSGNITNEKLLELCDKLLPKAGNSLPGAYVQADEPLHVVGHEGFKEMPVSAPMLCLGFKEKPAEGSRLQAEITADLMCELIAGESTDFYNELYDEGLINGSFFTESLIGKDYRTHLFGGETDYPDEVKNRLLQRIEQLKKDGFDPDRFREVKLATYGDLVLSLESNREIAMSMMVSKFKGYSLFDAFDVMESVTCEQLNQELRNSLNPEHSVVYKIIPSTTD